MTKNPALLDSLEGRVPWRRPVWFMRQAGRYLSEYREIRAKAGSFLDLCYSPEMAAEVTLQPLRRFDLDAAILFSDILVIPQALGCELSFVQNEGPKLSVVQKKEDVDRLDVSGTNEFLTPVFETVRLVRESIEDHITLIGFCGAPWTVATYMIEGGGSPERPLARKAAFEGEGWFDDLIDKIVVASIDYLEGQISAGAHVLQIFDSWASDLPPLERERYCFQPIARIVSGLRDRGYKTPIIGFAKGLGPAQLDFLSKTGVQALGLESNLDPQWISGKLTDKCVVQGNLDPVLLDVGGEALPAAVRNIVENIPFDRHIFNLGHGIRQTTRIENVETMIRTVREFDDKHSA